MESIRKSKNPARYNNYVRRKIGLNKKPIEEVKEEVIEEVKEEVKEETFPTDFEENFN